MRRSPACLPKRGAIEGAAHEFPAVFRTRDAGRKTDPQETKMATAAPVPNLPLFYRDLMPLNTNDHAKAKVRPVVNISHIAKTHAVPVTVEEFPIIQRHYPIIFSVGDSPVPLALMGLNEGVNVFLQEDGQPVDPTIYIPAYIRRYPFLLARLSPDSDEMSLCFDPTSGSIGDFKEGEALFDKDGKPTEAAQSILEYCEQFETAGQRTQAFMDELLKMDLLMDGEVAIQPNGAEQPFVYRGFKMIDEEKMRNLSGEKLRKMNQSGMLTLLFAHLFSLQQMRDVFGKQMAQGKAPEQTPQHQQPADADA
jgi:hypothetical protein